MNKIFLKYISIILTIYILSKLISTVSIENTSSLLLMGFVLLIVNLILKPILLLVTLPFTIITFGLFTFIVNSWTIMISDHFVTGISMGGALNSLLAAFIISLLHHFLRDMQKKA